MKGETKRIKIKIEENYIKGFNHSYLLAKYKPHIIENIVNVVSLNNYIQGLKDGKDAFECEKLKSRFQEIEKLHSQRDRKSDLDMER